MTGNGGRSGDRGQTSVLGVALLFGIAALGISVIVVFGGVALNDTQEASRLGQAEQAMTQFDSQVAEVALGDSAVQTVDFGGSEGTYSYEDTGTIRIIHVDYDGAGGNEELYAGSLGTVIYRESDTVIGYQGGGVWRQGPSGNATMVSPPEFHYRDGTLTLPVIRATGTGGAVSGSATATVRKTSNDFEQFYPDLSKTYSGGAGNRAYSNPLSQGYVEIQIESRFATAWAAYFQSRTDGEVEYFENNADDPTDDVVVLKLLTVGQTGFFQMPDDTTSAGLEVRGLSGDEHSLDLNFEITPRQNQESEFKNLRWGLYIDNGPQKFEFALGGGSSVDCGDPVPVMVYYTPDDHVTQYAWYNNGGVTVTCTDTDGDGTDERSISIDVTSGALDLEYDSDADFVSGSYLSEYNSEFSKPALAPSATLTAHSGHSDRTYNDNDVESMEFVVAHYFAIIGPNFNLQVSDQQQGNAAGVAEDGSGGFIDYEGDGRVVTFLHISENRIEVEFD